MDEYLVDIVRDDSGTVRIIAASAQEAATLIEQALEDEHVSSTNIRLYRLTRVIYTAEYRPRVIVLGDEPHGEGWRSERITQAQAER